MILLIDAFALRAIYLLSRKGEQKPRAHGGSDVARQVALYGIGVVAISIVIIILPSYSMTGSVSLSSIDVVVVGVVLFASLALQQVRALKTSVLGTYYVNVLMFGSLSICGLLVLLNLLSEWQHHVRWLFGIGS
jgi:hypothetical protein